MVRSRENLFGAYAFLVGVVLAVVVGLLFESPEAASGISYTILIIIGLIVGFSNSGDKSSVTFLIASLAVVIAAALGNQPLTFISNNNYVVNALRNILVSLLVLFVPVTIIVALKTVFAQAKI